MRRGVEVTPRVSRVKVDSFSIHSPIINTSTNKNHHLIPFSVTCGGGVYIRSLVRDLARKVGSRAHLASLGSLCLSIKKIACQFPFPTIQKSVFYL